MSLISYFFTLDSLCIIFLTLITVLVYKLSNGPHAYKGKRQQGFCINDSSLKYPFYPLAVSVGKIFAICLTVPPIVIFCTDDEFDSSLRVIKRYIFSLLCNIFVVLIIKWKIGRLRPHFWSVCKPIINPSMLSTQSGGEEKNNFITKYTCANSNIQEINTSRQSFYSAHACVAFHSAVWLTLYIQSSYSDACSLVKPLIQMFTTLVGLYPGASQVNNYWHHPSDVATGYAAGGLIACLNYYYVLTN